MSKYTHRFPGQLFYARNSKLFPHDSANKAVEDSDKIEILFNVIGEKVVTLVDKNQNAGNYLIQWDGRNAEGNLISSGIYFYRLNTDDPSTSLGSNLINCKKMILLR